MSLSTAGPGGLKAFTRNTIQLYRDCLRLARHIAGNTPKGNNLRRVLRVEFRKNSRVEDPALIEQLKSNAVRGLANYLMIESTTKDERLQKFASKYAQQEIKNANDELKKNLPKAS